MTISTPRRTISSRYRLPSLAALLALCSGSHDGAFAAPLAATPEAIWDEAALAEAGLTGPASYESPLHGYTVEWSDAWGLSRLTSHPVMSWPDSAGGGRDSLYLAHGDTESRLSFVSLPPDGRTLQQRFADATDALGNGQRVGMTLVLSGVVTWVERAEPSDAGERAGVTIQQLRDLDTGAVLNIWLPVEMESLEQVFDATHEVLVNGEPLWEEITIEEISAQGPGYDVGARRYSSSVT